VIKAFANKWTAEIWRTGKTRGSPRASVTKRTLALLDAVAGLDDLKCSPENPRGDRQGWHRFRIHDRYRNWFCMARSRCVRGRNYGLPPRIGNGVVKFTRGDPMGQVRHLKRRRAPLAGSPRRNSTGRVSQAPRHVQLRVSQAPSPSRTSPSTTSQVERRGISADAAVRRSRFFGTTEQFWLNPQGCL
jgi:plasmid maintenance system killer protein